MFLSDEQEPNSISPFSRRDFTQTKPRRHVNSQLTKGGKLQVLKGTTTIGVVCKDGVVLTTDTRATMGSFVAHKHAKKVYMIDHHLAMTIAGTVGDAQAIVEMLRANSSLYRFDMGRPIPIAAAARLVSNILFQARY